MSSVSDYDRFSSNSSSKYKSSLESLLSCMMLCREGGRSDLDFIEDGGTARRETGGGTERL